MRVGKLIIIGSDNGSSLAFAKLLAEPMMEYC